MHKDNQILKEVLLQLRPSLLNEFNWFDIWDRPLDSGIGYEWVVFASILNNAENAGWEVSLPIISYPRVKDLFITRNEIPYQHGAKAGHSFSSETQFSLSDRFIVSLLPKAILSKDGKYISIFKEGSPYHKIMFKNDYLDRPDIIFVPGKPTTGFPLLSTGNVIDFSYDIKPSKRIYGQLRVVDSNIRPIKSRYPSEGLIVPAIGIIECSVNKKLDVVKGQTNKYLNLFGSEEIKPIIVIATGNKLIDSDLHLVETKLDLPLTELVQEFQHVGEVALNLFVS